MYLYQSAPHTGLIPPPTLSTDTYPAFSMKRSIADVEQSSSDCDDAYNISDDSHAKSSSSMPSNQADTGYQMMSRKKRRGMIEKKRRDRINNSLNELRRLVPAAFEKQGSAKLEKAEILQMTVEHLRMLHAKGFDTFSFDPHQFAMEYHRIGFHECVKQVESYLANFEGMDYQDSLRLRLSAHLSRYSAQRESALKLASSHAAWNPSAFTTPSQFPSLGTASSSGESVPLIGSNLSHYNTSHSSSSESNSILQSSTSISQSSGHLMPPPPPPLLKSSSSPQPPPSSISYSSSSTGVHNISPIPQMSHHHSHPHHPSHPHPSNVHQYHFPGGYGPPPPPGSIQHQSNAAGVKYCRPWGHGELAY